jgi:WD40 repeat protein
MSNWVALVDTCVDLRSHIEIATRVENDRESRWPVAVPFEDKLIVECIISRLQAPRRQFARNESYSFVYHSFTELACIMVNSIPRIGALRLMLYPLKERVLAAIAWVALAPMADDRANAEPPALPAQETMPAGRIEEKLTYSPKLRITAHEGWVNGVAMGADDGRFFSIGEDEQLKVWSADTGELIASTQVRSGGLTALALIPGKSRIVVGGWDGNVKVLNAETLAEVAGWQAHDENITSLAVSPDGRQIATGSGDDHLKIWAAATGEEERDLDHANEYDITSVAWNVDGNQLASGDGDNGIRLWDATRGEELRSLTEHEGAVTCLAFSRDGKWMLSGSADDTLSLWNTAESRPKRTLRGHGDDIRAAIFLVDGKHIVSAGDDKTVRIWDVGTGRELALLEGHRGAVTSLAASQNGNRFVTGSEREIIVWERVDHSSNERFPIRRPAP